MLNEEHFCFCSDSFFFEIKDRQKKDPLTFNKVIEVHAKCKFGCGTCIEMLKEYLVANSLYLEAE